MTEERLYGNWMRPQKASIRGVDWRVAAVSAVGYLTALVVIQTDARLGTTILLAAVVLTAASAVRVAGSTLSAWVAGRGRWLAARRTGATSFRAVDPQGWVLPGPLARTTMVEVGRGAHAYGAVYEGAARRLTVTLRVASVAADLVDDAEHDAAVARWERWLESLGRRPEVAWVAVTVETSPSSGSRLSDMVADRVSPQAPDDCRRLMDALVTTSPGVAAGTESRVCVTFDMRGWDTQVGRAARRAGVTSYLPLLDHAVSSLEATLDGCGVTVLGRARPDQLAASLRTAFDPASAGQVELALSQQGRDAGRARMVIPEWEFAGPAAATEYRDGYVHDSGTSVSFVWAQAPRQLVGSSVLDALARPGRFMKRLTCWYVPTPAAQAMDAANAQVRWRWLSRMVSALPVIGRPSTADDDRDAAAAEQATREVAAGAGWVAQTVLVTVTVLDDGDLAAGVSEVEHAAGVSQLRLRRLVELQAAGFYAGLPAGLSLPELAGRWSR